MDLPSFSQSFPDNDRCRGRKVVQLLPARRRAAPGSVLSLIAGAFFIFDFSVVNSQAQGPFSACEDAAEIAVLSSPVAPWKGAPLRVVFAAEKPLAGELTLIAPNGSVAAKSRERHGGPPYFWFAEVAAPAAGTWRAKLEPDRVPGGCSAVAHEIAVRAVEPARPSATAASLWPVRNTWNRATENLYSAWIEKLFDAPLDAEPSWRALHEVLRDRTRNFLFNHLGLREDEMGLIIRPDCADLPYFLRAYFAFKMGLPFGYSKCSRGDGGRPPKCFAWWNIQNLEPPNPPASAAAQPPDHRTLQPPGPLATSAHPRTGRTPVSSEAPKRLGLAASFGEYLRGPVANGVHSGSARTRATDDNTDYYLVPLSEETLRPGAVYADPYGHVLGLARRISQSDGEAGVILAVDAQPDGTVARKRFWRGNFLFAQNPALGSPGFKRFRPIVRENARRASEGAGNVGRKWAKVPEQRARRRGHAGQGIDLRDDRRGEISRRRRAICVC